jgi:hypothetical protein
MAYYKRVGPFSVAHNSAPRLPSPDYAKGGEVPAKPKRMFGSTASIISQFRRLPPDQQDLVHSAILHEVYLKRYRGQR